MEKFPKNSKILGEGGSYLVWKIPKLKLHFFYGFPYHDGDCGGEVIGVAAMQLVYSPQAIESRLSSLVNKRVGCYDGDGEGVIAMDMAILLLMFVQVDTAESRRPGRPGHLCDGGERGADHPADTGGCNSHQVGKYGTNSSTK